MPAKTSDAIMTVANVMAILEDVDSKFQLVVESHQALKNDISALRDEMVDRFDLVDVKFSALNNKLDKVATNLDNHRSSTELHQAPRKRPLKRI